MSDDPVRKCPECLNDTAIRLVSAAGFQLKGSGWYATDFKNKNNEGAKKETKVSSETPGSEKKTSETKTAETKTSTESSKGEKA